MRAITVRQPWASAIIVGPKRVENRSWPWPSTLRLPSWIAIHAGARLDEGDLEQARRLWPECPGRGELPTRAILGVVQVVRGRIGTAQVCRQDPWATGPWCWVLRDPRPLPEPIPYFDGKLGLWAVPEHIHAEIDRQLGRVK